MTKLESKNLIVAVSELAKLNADMENADNVLCDAIGVFHRAEQAKINAEIVYERIVTIKMNAKAIVTDMINDLT